MIIKRVYLENWCMIELSVLREWWTMYTCIRTQTNQDSIRYSNKINKFSLTDSMYFGALLKLKIRWGDLDINASNYTFSPPVELAVC